MKLLRSSGIGLKEAKDAIEAHMSGKAPPSAPASHPTFSAPGMDKALPPAVVDALQGGSKIEAIRIMREQTGLGLKEAKDAVERYERTRPASPDALSPGQVSSTGSGIWWIVGLVLICTVGYLVLNRFG